MTSSLKSKLFAPWAEAAHRRAHFEDVAADGLAHVLRQLHFNKELVGYRGEVLLGRDSFDLDVVRPHRSPLCLRPRSTTSWQSFHVGSLDTNMPLYWKLSGPSQSSNFFALNSGASGNGIGAGGGVLAFGNSLVACVARRRPP